MKFSDMNERQKKVTMNVKYASWDLLGGLENTMSDNEPDSKEYKQAEKMLSDHEGLVKELYTMATTALYGEGYCNFSDAASLIIRDNNFCGKDFIMERCEKRITKEGY